MSGITVRGLCKSFGEKRVFSGLDFDMPEKRITVLLGPSGCGKTTILNILSGNLPLDSGTVTGTEGKRISYLFQEPRLLPWKTVLGNIEFVLGETMPEEEKRARIKRFLSLVGLSGSEKLYPRQLSGGMRQRTAIARAFSFPSEIILMDEPFQALDLNLKVSLLKAFVPLWEEESRTALFVTHDIQEALLLGHRIILLSALPAVIRSSIECPLPLYERNLADPALQKIERTLYELIMNR